MGSMLTLTAGDGHKFAAYRADPAGKPKGGVVVVQEIFGVNKHIRELCDGFAKDGYAALAPALFDRVERNVDLGYGQADMERGRALRSKIKWENVLADMQAAIDALADAGKVGVVGYCWGGSVAWRAATQLRGISCAVGYYGGQIAPFKEETPKVPVLLHFGETDASIPLSDVEAIKKAQPKVPVHLYPAGHGFSCDHRPSYHAESAKLARTRTLEFFAKNIG
ncbi:MAG TPA: dienelactone hydrolase family protein [Alphaproteobacteria bacterium]|nr:dienelactone hydrolase family protein [Alphaproteobacteria bacterium]